MTSDLAGGQSFTVSVQTSDLEEAREVCGEHLYPATIRLVDPAVRFTARFSFLHLADLTVADTEYGAAIVGECGELGSYHISLPVAGEFTASQDNRLSRASPSQAGVYRPYGTTVLHHRSADCRVLAVKIDQVALELQLATLLDASVRGPLHLSPELDVRRPPGRGCAALIRFLCSEIDNPTGLIREPHVAAPITESLLTALLHAVDHQYRDRLQPDGSPTATYRIGPAVDAIHLEPQLPHTSTGLARIAGLSVRRLRQEFRQRFGMAPMAYLRGIRLERAHAELLTADPRETSMNEVARRWGFPQSASFVSGYRARYHQDPAETLAGHGRD